MIKSDPAHALRRIELSPLDYHSRGMVRYLLCLSTCDLEVEELTSRWKAVINGLVRLYPFLAGQVVEVTPGAANTIVLEYDPFIDP